MNQSDELTLESLTVLLSGLPKRCASCDDVDLVIKAKSPQEFMDMIVDMRIDNPNKDFMVRIMPHKQGVFIVGRLQMK